jgi:hypothetical protein
MLVSNPDTELYVYVNAMVRYEADVTLNTESYHILELQDHLPEEVWGKEMAMYELEIEDEVRETIFSIIEETRTS